MGKCVTRGYGSRSFPIELVQELKGRKQKTYLEKIPVSNRKIEKVKISLYQNKRRSKPRINF